LETLYNIGKEGLTDAPYFPKDPKNSTEEQNFQKLQISERKPYAPLLDKTIIFSIQEINFSIDFPTETYHKYQFVFGINICNLSLDIEGGKLTTDENPIFSARSLRDPMTPSQNNSHVGNEAMTSHKSLRGKTLKIASMEKLSIRAFNQNITIGDLESSLA
jgi:hypothetical protein